MGILYRGCVFPQMFSSPYMPKLYLGCENVLDVQKRTVLLYYHAFVGLAPLGRGTILFFCFIARHAFER